MPTYCTKEQVILQQLHAKDVGTPNHPTHKSNILEGEILKRDIPKRDILPRNTLLERDILERDILKRYILKGDILKGDDSKLRRNKSSTLHIERATSINLLSATNVSKISTSERFPVEPSQYLADSKPRENRRARDNCLRIKESKNQNQSNLALFYSAKLRKGDQVSSLDPRKSKARSDKALRGRSHTESQTSC